MKKLFIILIVGFLATMAFIGCKKSINTISNTGTGYTQQAIDVTRSKATASKKERDILLAKKVEDAYRDIKLFPIK